MPEQFGRVAAFDAFGRRALRHHGKGPAQRRDLRVEPPLLCAPARRQEHHDLQPEAQAPRTDPVRHRAAPQRDLHVHARVQRRREPAHLEDGTHGSQGGHGQGSRRALPEKSRAALHRRFEHALLRTRRGKITYIMKRDSRSGVCR